MQTLIATIMCHGKKMYAVVLTFSVGVIRFLFIKLLERYYMGGKNESINHIRRNKDSNR